VVFHVPSTDVSLFTLHKTLCVVADLNVSFNFMV